MNFSIRHVVLGAALVAVAGCAKHETVADPARPVVLAQVVAGSGGDTAVFAGEVKPRYESDLGFRIGGKIVERLVDAGTRVRKGQVLARLDPADVGLQAEAAKQQVAAAQNEYDFAKTEFDRYQNLLEQKFVSASALDGKRNAMNTNQAKLAQARANLSVTQNQAAYATLIAPDDGVITAVTAESGQVVAAAQVVMRHARETEREVAIAVPEARINELARASEMAVVLVAEPGKPYRAQVREISPVVDPVTRTFAVRVKVADPAPALQWGMTANVIVAAAGASTASLLPATSIYQTVDGKPAVWVFDPAAGKVTLRPVIIAQYREDGVVIGSGLTAGEWVVATGANKLHEGQLVRPYEAVGRQTPSSVATSHNG